MSMADGGRGWLYTAECCGTGEEEEGRPASRIDAAAAAAEEQLCHVG